MRGLFKIRINALTSSRLSHARRNIAMPWVSQAQMNFTRLPLPVVAADPISHR